MLMADVGATPSCPNQGAAVTVIDRRLLMYSTSLANQSASPIMSLDTALAGGEGALMCDVMSRRNWFTFCHGGCGRQLEIWSTFGHKRKTFPPNSQPILPHTMNANIGRNGKKVWLCPLRPNDCKSFAGATHLGELLSILLR
jgi:hypothetical protein